MFPSMPSLILFSHSSGISASGSLVSHARVGKCSRLHSQPCALTDWTTLRQCAQNVTSLTQSWLPLASQYLLNGGWESVGSALALAVQASTYGRCDVSTRIGVGIECGQQSQPYSGVLKSDATVCWLLVIGTRGSVSSSCSSSNGKSTCARSTITMPA